jgi:CDP-diacylglycerol--glycerol-3-phosphate 3-phosphatidyltransferase
VSDRPHTLAGRIVTPPNALSFLRMLLLPPTLMALDRQDVGGTLPVILALGCALGSDALDGLLARWRGWVSNWGRVLDPLADKVYLGGVVLYLTLARGFPAWLLALVLARDAFLVASSAFLVRRYKVVFGASLWGKVSTVTLSLLVVAYVLRIEVAEPWLIGAATAALALSVVGYVRNALAFLRHGAARVA